MQEKFTVCESERNKKTLEFEESQGTKTVCVQNKIYLNLFFFSFPNNLKFSN